MNNSYGQIGAQQMYPNLYFGNPMPQQPVQRYPGLYGRLVNSIDEVKPQEVPMDGSVGIFPASDYSKIYAKYWDANGRIHTEVYERNSGSLETDTSSTNSFSAVIERLDKIEQMLSTKTEVTEDVQRTATRSNAVTKKSSSSE